MYIFRWFMKNPIILIALYVLSIVAILYSMTGGGNKDNVNTTEAVTSDSAKVDISNAPAIEPSTLTSALVDGELTTSVKDSSQPDLSQTTENSAAVTTETQQAMAERLAAKDSASTVEDNASEVDEINAETQFSEMSNDELLLMAREAYWNNGLEESAQIYQQLISASPDKIDYKGELGNVYWRQGFPKKAAALYAEISMPMIEEGNADKVANMVGFIGLFYPEKATDIHNKLQAGN